MEGVNSGLGQEADLGHIGRAYSCGGWRVDCESARDPLDMDWRLQPGRIHIEQTTPVQVIRKNA